MHKCPIDLCLGGHDNIEMRSKEEEILNSAVTDGCVCRSPELRRNNDLQPREGTQSARFEYFLACATAPIVDLLWNCFQLLDGVFK